MNISGDTAPIILHSYFILRQKRNRNMLSMPSQSFIIRIIKNFPQQVVYALYPRGADIHPRSFTNRFQPLQYINIRRGIVVIFGFLLSHINLLNLSKILNKKQAKNQPVLWSPLAQFRAKLHSRLLINFVLNGICLLGKQRALIASVNNPVSITDFVRTKLFRISVSI